MLYAYCVRRAGEPGPPPELRGVEGAPVRLLEEGDLGIWLSPGRLGERATVERIREHDRVVRAALRTATPLPVRFGLRFADEAAARAALREHRDRFLADLGRVAGRVEMGVRVTWDEAAARGHQAAADATAVRSGREYLELRRRRLHDETELRRRAAALLDRVTGCLAGLELQEARRLLPEPGVAGIVAHLVHRAQVGAYRERVEGARSACAGTDWQLSGPWAPYSFV